ncbi:MAG: hypothetical protein HRT66_12505, partial [Flavobacteriaceae bacterium]|nr:hypothetical protein [Flavobacteriaceae bacterium]
ENIIINIDKSGVYLPYSKLNIVLLSGNCKINLERMLDSIKPQKVIINSDNYRYNRDIWVKILEKKEIKYHDISSIGYYSIDY